jgi:hypothetical protein
MALGILKSQIKIAERDYYERVNNQLEQVKIP